MKTLFPTFFTIALFALTFHPLALHSQDTPSGTFEVPAEAIDATEEAPVGPITEITFEETTFDFGTVQEGEMVQHVFTFTNTGDEPLILMDARGSCGCTVPQWPRSPIAPGETASITVEFNSKNKKGKRNQKVTLTANTSPKQSFVYLTGEVAPRDGEEIFLADEEVLEEENLIDPDCFAIYPNPTADLLVLDMADHVGKTATISIYSKTGQMMAQREVRDITGKVEFQVGHYPAGSYIANVHIEGKKQGQSRCFVVVER